MPRPDPVHVMPKPAAMDVELCEETYAALDALLAKRNDELLRRLQELFVSRERPELQIKTSFSAAKGSPCERPCERQISCGSQGLRRSRSYDAAVEVHMNTKEKKASEIEMTEVIAESGQNRCTPMQEVLSKYVASWQFELFFTCLIMANAVMLGVQVEYTALNRGQPAPIAFYGLQQTFTSMFLLELVLRLLAEGQQFFCSRWNILDLLIVLASVLEFTMQSISVEEIESVSTTHFRIFRLVRITRFARVIRIVKVMRYVKALRTLVYSIALTLKSLMWSMLLLVFVFFVFGILFTDTVTDHLMDNPGPWPEGLQKLS